MNQEKFLNAWSSPWNCCQIGVRLEAKHIICQKLYRYIYSNRLKKVIFGMKCVFHILEHNPKGGHHEIEYFGSSKAKNKIQQRIELKEEMRKMGSFVLLSRLLSKLSSLKRSKWLIFCIFFWWQHKIVVIWASTNKRSYWVLSKICYDFGVTACEMLRVEVKKTCKVSQKYWKSAFPRVAILLITIRIQQSIAFFEKTK